VSGREEDLERERRESRAFLRELRREEDEDEGIKGNVAG